MGWPNSVDRSQLVITWFSGTGAGGQHRNKHANCCRILHVPTGIKATGQDHAERTRNRRDAFRRLAKRLVPIMKGERREPARARSEVRVRTYHVPRGKVKDHRISGEFDLKSTLDGNLDQIIRRLHAETR